MCTMARWLICFVMVAMVAVLSGCVEDYVDPAFVEGVQEFEEEYGVHVSFGVVFVEEIDHPRAGGNCYKTLLGDREVQILRSWWEGEEDILMRKSMLFHELGHCALYLKHNNALDERGLEVSIMHKAPPHPGGLTDWENLKKQMHDEI